MPGVFCCGFLNIELLISVSMMTSSNGNLFRVTGPYCGHRWIPLTKASDAELWCFLWRPNKRLSKQSWVWWFETPSCSLWRQCNEGWLTDIEAQFDEYRWVVAKTPQWNQTKMLHRICHSVNVCDTREMGQTVVSYVVYIFAHFYD